MKREYVIVLCIAIVAIFLVVERGTTAWWKTSAEKQSDQRGQEGEWADQQESDEGKKMLPQTSRTPRPAPQKIVTESGLVYKILEQGEGEHPGPTSRVKVHYVGTFTDGRVFDSSRDRGGPAVFPLNAVIKGWTEGLQLMKPGARYHFEIPPDLAYGDSGAGGAIPPGSSLIFEVELISIEAP